MMRIVRFSPAIAMIAALACSSASSPRSSYGKVTITADASALSSVFDVTGVWVQLHPTGSGSAVQGWASLISGKWSTTFENVPAGTYDVYAKAANGSGQTLYETPAPYPGGPITVTSGGSSTVALVLQGPSPATTTNSVPIITSLYANQTQVSTSATVQLSAAASDPDPGDSIAFAWTSSSGTFGAVTSGAGSSHTTWTPPGTGTFTVTVTATDNHGASTQLSLDIVVSAASPTGGVTVAITLNNAPLILELTSTNAQAAPGQGLPLTAVAGDVDGDPLAFGWSASCAGTFADPVTIPDPLGTRSSTTFTPAASSGSTCVITLTVSDGRGGSASAQLGVSFATAIVGADPAFFVQASPTVVVPGQQPELAVIASDGTAHPGWSYAWSDGLSIPTDGIFTPKNSGDASDVFYAPAYCGLLGGGILPIALAVTVSDSTTGLSNSASVPITVVCPAVMSLTTETLYAPEQGLTTYEPAPAGYEPVYTELVARHGARGMSSEGADLAVYDMWTKAQADGALTALGQQLGPDVYAFIQANTLLGAGVQGITGPGYGNLSRLGAMEHQNLATRLLQRLPSYFNQVAANGRQIVVQTSGVNRAYDSSRYFVGALEAGNPALTPLVTYPAAITGYGTKPAAQLPGTNRFLLYFHKLSAAQDQVTSSSDPYYATYQASLAYQSFKSNDPVQTPKVNAINALPEAGAAAQIVMQRLFTQDFIDKLGTAGYSFTDAGSYAFTGPDGKTYTTTGSGKTSIKSALDAANQLFAIYIIVPAMPDELDGMDFTKYFPAEQAAVFNYLGDAVDFYQMGPGATEDGTATYAMAQGLLNDFFNEVDAIQNGTLTNGAKLRFTHAEIVTPFASILNLKNIFVQIPAAQTYTYAPNSPWNADLTAPTASPWRDQVDAPMAGNVQWDVYRGGDGQLIVKMLLNEQEIDFSAACDGARHAPGSRFYDYAKLESCYGRAAN